MTYTLTVLHPFGGRQDWHYPSRAALDIAITFWRNAHPCTADGVTGDYTWIVTEHPAPTCATCKGKGYYRKDASSYFACDCEDSVTKQDSHSDTDVEWSDPEAHEELARDIDRHDHDPEAHAITHHDAWPGVHPLEGSPLDACPACSDLGYVLVHPGNHWSPPEFGPCVCAAGEPHTTYPGSPSVEPPPIPYTDADFASVTF